MDQAWYAAVLVDKLGADGYSALNEMAADRETRLLDAVHYRFDLMDERFERRLAEECGQLRVEMHDGFGELRAEMHSGFGQLRADMGNQRADLMKWALLFWVTQAAAVAGIVTALR